MSVLEYLYNLEIEFHRQAGSLNEIEANGIHVSYALQHGYESLLRSLGTIQLSSLVEAKTRMAARHDPRIAEAAFHSLSQFIVR